MRDYRDWCTTGTAILRELQRRIGQANVTPESLKQEALRKMVAEQQRRDREFLEGLYGTGE